MALEERIAKKSEIWWCGKECVWLLLERSLEWVRRQVLSHIDSELFVRSEELGSARLDCRARSVELRGFDCSWDTSATRVANGPDASLRME